MHFLCEAHAPPWLVDHSLGKTDVGIQLAYFGSDILKIFTFHERATGGASNGESLEIPREMLTQIKHGHLLIAIIEFGQQFRMAFNHTAHIS